MPAAWSSWLPDLLPSVPGCPVLMAEHELRRSAQALCERARLWQEDLGPFAVAPAQATVEILPPAEAKVHQIMTARYDGIAIQPAPIEGVERDGRQDWRTVTASRPSHYVQLAAGTLRLTPVPDVAAATGVTARAALAPSDTATGVPDWLRAQFHDTILVGAKARLWMMLKQPWADAKLGGLAAMAFDQMIDTAATRAYVGFGRAVPRARPTWA